MSSYGYLRVGSVEISSHRNGVDNELFALFRDDMLDIKPAMASEYYTEERGYSSLEPSASASPESDHEISIVLYSSPASVIADRLDLMGATAQASLSFLSERLTERAFDKDDPMNGHAWIEAITSASDNSGHDGIPEHGSKRWLLDNLACRDYSDERYILRCVLLAFPDALVTLDLTDLNEAAWLDGFPLLESMASEAARTIKRSTTDNIPIVVLTEGRTDSEFLSYGLQVLYPHLTDLVRFLDFDQKPEGGSGALVRMARAFGAAGIANRVIAIFDNDTAAADALKNLDLASLPANVQIAQYPSTDLASSYPTLGPPALGSPVGSINLADINGLAGSIELYLGEDVLRKADGTLRPVQWKSFIAGMKRYQGEVVEKDAVQKAFRAKSEAALGDPAVAVTQDWKDMRKILDAIRKAA